MASIRDGLRFLLFHGSLLATTVYFSYFSDPGSSLFSWHPFLMIFSVHFATTAAIHFTLQRCCNLTILFYKK